MLYDRIKWHYDENLPDYQDPEAASALLDHQTRAVAPSLWVPDGGYQIHVTDHAEFQRPDPTWTPPPGLRGMVIRVSDGVYREPSFATDFRIMDEMLQRDELDYCMWYHLPSPNVSRQRAMDAIAAQIRESGVKWGRPGHGLSIDDEPTPYHDAVGGQAMVDLRNALQDTYQREELHYVGLYAGNYGFISEHGWQLWAPWPLSNGDMPSKTTNLVMQQWGVADAGGAPGFPNRPVDVNHLFDPVTLDRLTGRTAIDPLEAWLSSEEAAAQITAIWNLLTHDYPISDIHAAVAQDAAGNPVVRASRGTLQGLNQLVRKDWPLADIHRAVAEDASGNQMKTPGVLQEVLTNSRAAASGGIDVDKLASALAARLGDLPGPSAKAIAEVVAEVLGERLTTGDTPNGPT